MDIWQSILFCLIFGKISCVGEMLWYNSLVALSGEVAVPCNLQPAIAGLNSRLRFAAVLPERVQEALKPGSHAMGTYEPGEDRKVAAVSNVFMCREGA